MSKGYSCFNHFFLTFVGWIDRYKHVCLDYQLLFCNVCCIHILTTNLNLITKCNSYNLQVVKECWFVCLTVRTELTWGCARPFWLVGRSVKAPNANAISCQGVTFGISPGWFLLEREISICMASVPRKKKMLDRSTRIIAGGSNSVSSPLLSVASRMRSKLNCSFDVPSRGFADSFEWKWLLSILVRRRENHRYRLYVIVFSS